MRIESYSIQSGSYYSFEKIYERTEKLQVWYNPSNNNNTQTVSVEQSKEPVLKLSDEEKAKLKLIKYLLEKLTGKKVRLLALELSEEDNSSQAQETENQSQARPSFGMIYESSQRYFESEKMTFSTAGTVKTKDGRTIDFSLSLKMERSFYFEENFQLRVGEALKDPIVLNFDNLPPTLSPKEIRIDLDLDGALDRLQAFSSKIGFLALDLNENGKIDSGKELFGPTTGNGFKELSKYDADGNKWIDEADPIFARLKIWFVDENGDERLFSLKEMNVGAIYLGFVPTKFSLYDGEELQGRLASSSLYLTEDGKPGAIHQIDLKA
ncbi:hypothetical protein ACSFC1_07835 [Pseudothermotoga sp. U03pept]|uniref:hypothetical protein n=1 Tax=Pseudothermotoga sp. U03pept TaxID=3447012 RepID=UPI003F0DD688